jgi:hypothetical protein
MLGSHIQEKDAIVDHGRVDHIAAICVICGLDQKNILYTIAICRKMISRYTFATCIFALVTLVLIYGSVVVANKSKRPGYYVFTAFLCVQFLMAANAAKNSWNDP